MKSHIQRYIRNADGTFSIEGQPGVTVIGQGQTERPAWEFELGLPVYEHEWQALAAHSDLSAKHLEFVLADESANRIPGNRPFQPRKLICPAICRLELAHSSFLIGSVFDFRLRAAGKVSGTIGEAITAKAVLWNSALAAKAWEGVKRGVFSHACVVLLTPQGGELGTGHIMEVTLTTEVAAGCQNARILKSWEIPAL